MDFCRFDSLKIVDKKVVWNNKNCTDCDECIKNCPHSSSPKTKQYSANELYNEIEKYLIFTSGITFSGGECTLQYDFLLEMLKKTKVRGISAYIDTNLNIETEKLAELSKYFDKAMPDIKAFDSRLHTKLTGVDSDLMLKNFEFLLKNDKIYEVRTVVIPEFLDNEQTVFDTSKMIAKYNSKIRYKLIKYRKHGVKNPDFADEPSDELMEKLKKTSEKNGCENVVLI